MRAKDASLFKQYKLRAIVPKFKSMEMAGFRETAALNVTIAQVSTHLAVTKWRTGRFFSRALWIISFDLFI